MTRLAIVAALALVAVSSPPAMAAPDCAGGTLVRLAVRGGHMRLDATVTRAGLEAAALVGAGLRLRLVEASDPGTALWDVSLPAERFEAVGRVRARGQNFDVWLYRGAWEEWEPHEIERAVPVSPDVLERKKLAIFRHQSQKDRAMFPGASDPREFWQRAEDRNKATAAVYDALGLPEFYALEAFVRWKPSSGN